MNYLVPLRELSKYDILSAIQAYARVVKLADTYA